MRQFDIIQSIHIPKRTKSAICFIALSLYVTVVSSQEDASQSPVVSAEYTKLSETELLRRAVAIRANEPQISIQLATEVLRIAKDTQNHQATTRAHSLLGELFQKSKDTTQSKHHFLQASLIYQDRNDTRNQIISTVDYVNVFFSEKSYDEGLQIVDNLLPIAKKHGEELLIATTLITKGNGFYQKKDYEDAITAYTKALDYLSDQDDVVQSRLALTYHQIAQSHKHLRNREKSIYFYKNALDIYTVLRNQKSVANSLKNIADVERSRGNYVIALDYSIRGLEIRKQLNDPKALAKALRALGITYRKFGRYEKSLEHINEAYLIYKKENNTTETAETSNQVGLVYTRLKQFDQARSFYQLTIDMPEDEIKPTTLATALREIAVIDLQAGNLESAMAMAQQAHNIYQNKNYKIKSSQTARIIGKIYREQLNSDKAIQYFREALSLAEKAGNEKYQIKSLTQLGSTLIDKDTSEAILLLKKSLDLAKKNNIKTAQLYALRSLRQAEKSRGDIAESLRFSEEEIALSQIIQKETEESEIFKAKAKLDSHKKEMELDSLRKKIKLDQLEIAQKNSEIEIVKQANRISELELTENRYASIALTTLLVICLAFATYIYRIFVASRKRNKELDYLAARDPLTDCFNRRILFDLMNQDFSNIELLGEYSVIMADIDHFKQINDNHGHGVGDSVISDVADILRSSVRKNDITARYGGEEFCIVLPSADQNQAIHIAETIRHKVETHRFDNLTVTCSFGVTSIHFNAKTPAELIDQADLALYKSKTSGRNCVTLWNETLEGKNQNAEIINTTFNQRLKTQ